MNVDRAVFLMAGTITLLGLLLALIVSQWFLLLPAFVGANMLQVSITGLCPAAMIFKRMGMPAGCAFN